MTSTAHPYRDTAAPPMTQNSGGPVPSRMERGPRSASGRYSRFVQWTKLGLATVALMLIALVGIWPQLRSRDGGLPLGISSGGREDAESLHMVNPRYTGLDENSLPFEVTADLASQESAKSDVITLDNPKADMAMKDGSWMAVSATSGVYGQKTQLLDLSGAVNLFHDSGYEFNSTSATIDLNTGAGEGQEPTIGHGPAGEIEGEGFRFTDKGKTILFTGKAKLILFPNADDAAKRATSSAGEQ